MSDLVSVLALPAVWSGQEPRQIVATFHDAIIATLNLDFLYTRIEVDADSEPIEVVRVTAHYAAAHNADEVCQSLKEGLGDDPRGWSGKIRGRLRGEETTFLSIRLGLEGEIGVAVAGSERADFPSQSDRLLLGVAANQMTIGMQQARLLSEQRRMTAELDKRVAERTQQLAETNDELRRQIAKRELVEKKLRNETSELRRSKARSQAILDSALDCLVAIDHEARITEFNPAAEHTFGHGRSEVIGKLLSDVLVPPSLREKHEQGFARYLATGESKLLGRRLEMTALRSDGSEIPVELAITRIALPGPPSFTAYLRDITERKRNEDALQEALVRVARGEERWRSVFENSAVGVALADLDGRLLATNPVYQQMLGYSDEELRSLTFFDLTHEEFVELNRELVDELLAGERHDFQIEKQYRRKDGSLLWARTHLSLVPGSERVDRFLMGIVDNISDAKRAEKALQESERNLISIINTIPTTAWSTLPDGYCDFLNQRWLDYAGMTAEEAQGWGWAAVVHPDDAAGLQQHWLERLASGEPVEVEARMRRFDGVYRWFLFRANPMRDEAGNIVKWYGTNIDIEDRKQAEQVIRASEINLRQIIDSISGLVCTMSPAGVTELVNRPIMEYFGKSFEELQNWTLGNSDAVHPEDLPRVVSEFGHSITTGAPFDTEVRLRRFDGVYRWFHNSGRPVLDTDGRITRWYFLITDIDDRKRAEEALRTNERNLNLTLNTIPALTWSARTDGSAESFNHYYLDYVGLTLDQAQGWGWAEAIHPEDMNRLSEAWQSMMAEDRGGECEARLRRFDGAYRWFLFRANPLRDEAGATVKWYGTNTDIDDRKHAEEELRRNEAFLATAQQLSRTGSFFWRVATDEILWSEQLYRIFDFVPGMKLTLELIASRIHPEDMHILNDMVVGARIGSELEHDYRILLPDGSVKYLHVLAHGTGSNDGHWEYTGAVQDVTERRLSHEALDRARSELANISRSASLGVLTASIAHEVNQPLSGIVTNAGTCLRMLDSDPPNIVGARETARRAIRDGNRASEVITRLRSLFKRKEVAAESIDLNDAVREVIALSLNELQSNKVLVRYELADDLPPVMGDRIQLQQVILNLLRNASDAMRNVDDRGRHLLIKSECVRGNEVQFTVRDTGIGLAPTAADRLFESFYTTKEDGMGIGLSVSRSIIEAHRGRIWALANDGPGASFVFAIPCDFSAEPN